MSAMPGPGAVEERYGRWLGWGGRAGLGLLVIGLLVYVSARLAPNSDLVMMAGIALLASCSIPCLAAVIPLFHARRERIFVAICVMQIAVLVLAASGILAISH